MVSAVLRKLVAHLGPEITMNHSGFPWSWGSPLMLVAYVMENHTSTKMDDDDWGFTTILTATSK